ncbi:hypothetical protein KSP39_PZI005119 [Platanthera zijinensis]|uniref:Uncharacterized protein n=1 Tax=Platanthera zijinensis TaxID=2320716 RepID=A0AAP0GAZ8_9ASPA
MCASPGNGATFAFMEGDSYAILPLMCHGRIRTAFRPLPSLLLSLTASFHHAIIRSSGCSYLTKKQVPVCLLHCPPSTFLSPPTVPLFFLLCSTFPDTILDLLIFWPSTGDVGILCLLILSFRLSSSSDMNFGEAGWKDKREDFFIGFLSSFPEFIDPGRSFKILF